MSLLRDIKRSEHRLSCFAPTLAAMDAAAVAALAAVVDHDHARALNQLLQESVELREQLEQQRQQLEQQRQELEQQWQLLEQQHTQIHRQGLQVTQRGIVISFAYHDLKAGNIAAARERLYDYAT